MIIHAAVFSRMSADQAITAVVADRIYPRRLPQGARLPAIIYQQISNPKQRTLGGGSDTVYKPRFQISCLAGTFEEARQLARLVSVCWQDYAGTVEDLEILEADVVDDPDEYEDITGSQGSFHVPVDVVIIYKGGS